MNLEELAALENEWLAKQPEGGFDDERDALYKRIGMYEAWQDIFHRYVALAREGDLEALKHALFLHWYGCSEPHWLNGIRGFDQELVRETLAMVDDLARNGKLDTEFEWMLPYYYFIADFYLDYFDGFDRLKKVSRKNPHRYKKGCLKSFFDNRGQLGEYWQSIQDNLIGNRKIDPEKHRRDKALHKSIEEELATEDAH
jgi:hypothetical protein